MLQTDLVPSQSYAQRAARWAVFTPCCGPTWKQKPLVDVLDHVRWLWEKQLDALADVQLAGIGTHRPNGAKALTYWKNCPPFGVGSKPTRPCKRSAICPFCYARGYVVKAMRTLEKALFAKRADGVSLAQLDDTMIVDYTISIRFTCANRHWQATRAGREPVWESIMQTMQEGRRREVSQLSYHGAAVLHRIQFDADAWTLLRSGVFLCDRKDFALRPFKRADCELLRYDETVPTRDNLARAVGRAFRYPDTVLVTAPEIVREYVENLRNKRLLERYGVVRLARNSKALIE